MIKEIEERHQREKESNSYINEQQCFDDREYLLSLVKRQREALEKLNHVLNFDFEQETWPDEALLNCMTGTELTIRANHIEHIKALNEAKRFAKQVL